MTSDVEWGFPGGFGDKEFSFQCRRHRFNHWVRKIPWRKKWQLTAWTENPMDRGAWWATVHRVTKSQTLLKRLSMHTPNDVESLFMCIVTICISLGNYPLKFPAHFLISLFVFNFQFILLSFSWLYHTFSWFFLWDLSSPIKDGTRAPVCEACSPNHWSTREVPHYLFLLLSYKSCFIF